MATFSESRSMVGGTTHARVAAELHQAEVDARRQQVDELSSPPSSRRRSGPAARRWPASTATRRSRASPWPGRAAPSPRRSGCATPTVSTDRPTSSSAKVRCRRQPGRRGATRREQFDVAEPRDVLLAAQLQQDVDGSDADHGTSSSSQAGARKCISAPLPAPARLRRRAMTNRTTSVSQSRSVRSCRCPRPACRSMVAICARCVGGRRSVPLAQLGAGGLHLELVAGLGIDEGHQPGRRQLQLARVEDLDGRAADAGRTARAAAVPSR